MARPFSELRDELRRKRIIGVLAHHFPCGCTPDYTERGLVAPDCWAHDLDEVADDILAVLSGSPAGGEQ